MHTFSIAMQYSTQFKKSFSLTLLMQNLSSRLQSQLSEACRPQCRVETESNLSWPIVVLYGFSSPLSTVYKYWWYVLLYTLYFASFCNTAILFFVFKKVMLCVVLCFNACKPKLLFAQFWLEASAATENSAAILSCSGPASPVRLSPAHRCRTHAAPACSFGVQHAALSDIVHG